MKDVVTGPGIATYAMYGCADPSIEGQKIVQKFWDYCHNIRKPMGFKIMFTRATHEISY